MEPTTTGHTQSGKHEKWKLSFFSSKMHTMKKILHWCANVVVSTFCAIVFAFFETIPLAHKRSTASFCGPVGCSPAKWAPGTHLRPDEVVAHSEETTSLVHKQSSFFVLCLILGLQGSGQLHLSKKCGSDHISAHKCTKCSLRLHLCPNEIVFSFCALAHKRRMASFCGPGGKFFGL